MCLSCKQFNIIYLMYTKKVSKNQIFISCLKEIEWHNKKINKII